MWDSETKWANPHVSLTEGGLTASCNMKSNSIWGVCCRDSFAATSTLRYRWSIIINASIHDPIYLGLVYRDDPKAPDWRFVRDFSTYNTFYLSLSSTGMLCVDGLGKRPDGITGLLRNHVECDGTIRADFELCFVKHKLRVWINGSHVGDFSNNIIQPLALAAPMASIAPRLSNDQEITIATIPTIDILFDHIYK